MSFSNPKLSNPCKKFIRFKGDKGIFQWFNKEQGESGENVELFLPARFIVLDQLTTIIGFSNKDESGIYSNEIHSLNDEILRVKSFKGEVSIIGKYSDIKDEVKASGGKYCKSVYVMLKTGESTFELANFQMSGASFSSWLDYSKKIDFSRFGVEIGCEMLEGKTGGIKYKIPQFTSIPLSRKLVEQATMMDKELQKFLNEYKKGKIEDVVEKTEAIEERPKDPTDFDQIHNEVIPTSNNTPLDDDDDLPF